MKKFLVVLFLWTSHLFPNIVDEVNFLTLDEQSKLNSISDDIYKKTKVNTNLIIMDSRLKLSKKSFYGSSNSVFIVLTIDKLKISNIDIFTSTNLAINNLYRNEFDKLIDNNAFNNKTLNKLEYDGITSLKSIDFYKEYRNKQFLFIEGLFTNSKYFYINDKFSIINYLKNHAIISYISILLSLLILVKIIFIIIKSKKE